jgi:predicted PhzF superfamily epimerase YddE/YHI9
MIVSDQTLERLSAFTTDPNGGNPAGVWVSGWLASEQPERVRSLQLITATLTSVEPRQRPLDGELLAAVLDATHWTPSDLDPDLAPGLAYAGAGTVVTQGVDMGRPSRIDVHIPSTGGISVTGTAVPIPHTEQDEPAT